MKNNYDFLEDFINLKDKLFVYLTVEKIKPSTFIVPLITETTKLQTTIGWLKPSRNPIEEIKIKLSEAEVFYHVDGNKLFIGSDKNNLEGMVNAKDDREIGIALGYPSDAVEAYLSFPNLGRDGYFTFRNAAKQNAEVPSYLAYKDHMPAEMKIIEGKLKISESSKNLFKKYQSYVRENNFYLAELVEQEFDEKVKSETESILIDGNISDFLEKLNKLSSDERVAWLNELKKK